MPVFSVVMTPNSITVRNVTNNRSEITVDRSEVPLTIQGIFQNEIRSSNLRKPKTICASRLVCLDSSNPAYLWYLEEYSSKFTDDELLNEPDISSLVANGFWYKNNERDQVSR